MRTLLFAGLVFFAAACGHGPAPRAERPPALPPQQPLGAESKWFAGSVLARVTIDSAQPPGATSPTGTGGPISPPSGGGAERSGGGFRIGLGGAGGGGARGGSGEGPGHEGDGRGGPPRDSARPESGGPNRGPMLAPPRQMLQIAFTNHSPETISVAVTDLKTPFGNFAVRPERLPLAPSETASVNPMFASYPDNLDEVEVTLTLSVGGNSETQTLRLKPMAP